MSQKTGLNDPHWVSHASHILNISLSFILSYRVRMNYPGWRLVVSLNESKLMTGLALPGLYILLPRWRKMTRGPSSERMAGVVGGAAAVTESETGLAPRVAKFQCEM